MEEESDDFKIKINVEVRYIGTKDYEIERNVEK